MNPRTNLSQGHGFITFATVKAAQEAVKNVMLQWFGFIFVTIYQLDFNVRFSVCFFVFFFVFVFFILFFEDYWLNRSRLFFFTLVGQSCFIVKILLNSSFFFFEVRREETRFNYLVSSEIWFNEKINRDCVTQVNNFEIKDEHILNFKKSVPNNLQTVLGQHSYVKEKHRNNKRMQKEYR
jgi:hypothetical protein